jgi:acyl-CoA synthetase (AMP-forming)/AMP-acid ligase II/thioesterase domain-containing protein/acyl carrier protein
MSDGHTGAYDAGGALKKGRSISDPPVLRNGGRRRQGNSPLALAAGGILPLPLPRNLPTVLVRAAQDFPLAGVRYILRDGSEWFETYASLLTRAQSVLASLISIGVRPQDFVLLNLDESADFLAAFWACLLGGAVPVPTTPIGSCQVGSANLNRLLNVVRILKKGWLLSSSASDMALRSAMREMETNEIQLVSIDPLFDCSLATQLHNPAADQLAVLLFTSGSTGRPKGVMLSHGNMLSSCMGSVHVNCFTSNEISLNWLTLSHIGALMRSIREICLGATQIQVSSDRILHDPVRWLDLLTRFDVTTSWAPNFAYGLIVGRLGDGQNTRPWDFSRLKSLWTSGEPIAPRTMKRFLALLEPYGMTPGALHTAWGMTEACFASFSHTYVEELLKTGSTYASVGQPIPGISFRITDGHQRILSEETIGELQIKGPVCAYGYYGEGKSNRNHFSEDGWLRTGDLGLISEGKLVITGRAKDVIIVNGLNYSNYEIEAVVEDCKGVESSYAAACGIHDPDSNTDRLVIFFSGTGVEESDLPALINRIRRAIIQNIGLSPDLLIPVQKEEIPKTGAGKIQRHLLCKRFQKGDFDAIIKKLELLSSNPCDTSGKLYREKSLGTDGLSGGNARSCKTSGLANESDRTPQSSASRQWSPNTPIEKTLAEIWAEVLGKPPSSPREDFFDAGGQSLQTVSLLAEIEEKFGKSLKSSLLFQNSRFNDLVKIITREDPEQSAWQFLAPLQSSGSRPPIFCFHSVGGFALGYRRLAVHFGSDQPLYGLQAPDSHRYPPQRRSIERMCTDYLREICQVRPHGPYFLLGHSWGGLLAFEAARQLSKQGEKVGWLALLDTRGPGYSRSDHTLGKRVLTILKTLVKLPLNEKWRYIVHNFVEIPDYIYKGFWFLLTPKTRLAPNDIELQHIIARRQYHPGPYKGKTLLFRAALIDDDLRFDFDPALGWKHYVSGGLDIIEIPGDHYSIVSDPALAILTPKLMREMDRVLHDKPATAGSTDG